MSGGGTADKRLCVWNILSASTTNAGNHLISEVDTGSQVCNLVWSPFTSEFATSHGFSDNSLSVWRCGNNEKSNVLTMLSKITAHSKRIIHLTISEDGETVVSGGGEGTLKYWNLFQKRNNGGRSYENVLMRANGLRTCKETGFGLIR